MWDDADHCRGDQCTHWSHPWLQSCCNIRDYTFFPSNTLQLRKLSELKMLNQLIAPSHSILSLGRDRDSLGFKLGFFPSPEDAARDLSLALLHAEYVFYI